MRLLCVSFALVHWCTKTRTQHNNHLNRAFHTITNTIELNNRETRTKSRSQQRRANLKRTARFTKLLYRNVECCWSGQTTSQNIIANVLARFHICSVCSFAPEWNQQLKSTEFTGYVCIFELCFVHTVRANTHDLLRSTAAAALIYTINWILRNGVCSPSLNFIQFFLLCVLVLCLLMFCVWMGLLCVLRVLAST